METDMKEDAPPSPEDWPSNDRQALAAAETLLKLVRHRRYHFEEFLEGDGPYWISIGLYINDQIGVASTMDHILEFADESIETSRYILRQLIENGYVVEYRIEGGLTAYRQAGEFSIRFGRFLTEQYQHIQQAHATIGC